LVPEVPKDAVACLWGYEADHPFEEQTQTLAEAGLPFYVCPGTSSWQSIGGRLDNMLANVRSAAHWGAQRGARGLLVTDWGDRGHLQPSFASLPGFLVAADLAWNPRAAEHGERALDGLLEAHLSPLGRLVPLPATVSALGRAAHGCESRVRNASPLSVLLTKFDAPFPPAELQDLHPGRLGQVDEFIEFRLHELARHEELVHPMALAGLQDARAEAELMANELHWAGGMMR